MKIKRVTGQTEPTRENIDEVWELDEEYQEAIIKVIREALPDTGKIMCLSYTGSRAFGWGSQRYDIDVHGFLKKPTDREVWWDTMHIGCGSGGYDINLSTIRHLHEIEIEYAYWTTWQDMSKPFFIADEFDYDEFMSKCKIDYISITNIKRQLQRLELHPENPRTALHSYRVMMTPIYYIATGEIEINVMKLNEFFDLQELPTIRERYALRDGTVEIDWEQAENEIDSLFALIKDLKEKYDEFPSSKEESTRRKIEVLDALGKTKCPECDFTSESWKGVKIHMSKAHNA